MEYSVIYHTSFDRLVQPGEVLGTTRPVVVAFAKSFEAHSEEEAYRKALENQAALIAHLQVTGEGARDSARRVAAAFDRPNGDDEPSQGPSITIEHLFEGRGEQFSGRLIQDLLYVDGVQYPKDLPRYTR